MKVGGLSSWSVSFRNSGIKVVHQLSSQQGTCKLDGKIGLKELVMHRIPRTLFKKLDSCCISMFIMVPPGQYVSILVLGTWNEGDRSFNIELSFKQP